MCFIEVSFGSISSIVMMYLTGIVKVIIKEVREFFYAICGKI